MSNILIQSKKARKTYNKACDIYKQAVYATDCKTNSIQIYNEQKIKEANDEVVSAYTRLVDVRDSLVPNSKVKKEYDQKIKDVEEKRRLISEL